MLTRAVDEILRAAHALPQHLVAARRIYGHNPAAVEACERLQTALADARTALLSRREETEVRK